MANQLSSEEALNSILNILQTNINMQNANARKTPELKSGDTVTNIITGKGGGKGGDSLQNAGELIKALADGISAITNIDMSKLESAGKSINAFVKNVTQGMPTGKDGMFKLLKPLSDLMNGIAAVVLSGVMNMKVSLNPMKGYLIGRQIGQFLSQILKATKDAKIDKSMANLGKLLEPLALIVDSSNKASVKNIIKLLNKHTGKIIAGFFDELVHGIPDGKNIDKTVKSLASLMGPIVTIAAGKVGIMKLMLIMNKHTGKLIGGFFAGLIKGIPEKEKVMESLSGVAIILNVLFNAKKNSFKLIHKMADDIDIIDAYKINLFLRGLVEGDWEKKENAIKAAEMFFKGINSVIKHLVAALIVITVAAAFAPMSVILATIVLGVVIAFSIWMIRSLADIDPSSADSTATLLQATGKAILMLMASVALIAMVKKVFGIGAVITGVIVLMLVIYAVKRMIYALNDKDIKQGVIQAMDSLRGMAWLLIAISACTFLIAVGIDMFGLKNIVFGLAIVALVLVGMIAMVRKLAEINQDGGLDAATSSMVKLSLCFAVLALTIRYVVIPIGKHPIYAITGALIIVAIMGLLIGGLYLLAAGRLVGKLGMSAMIQMTLIYLGLALITKSLLIPIGKKAGKALKGAAITLFILAGLILGVHLLGNVKTTTLMEALKGLAFLTLIYLGIGLITKFLLIPIGKFAKEAVFGAGVTLFLMLGLVLGVKLLGTVDTKTLGKAVLATAAIAIILLGIALITKEILIPIGKNAGDAIKGAAIVAGVIIGFGAIFFAISKLWKFKKEIAQGAALMGGVAIVIAIIGKLVKSFAKDATEIYKLGVDNITKGSLAIVGIIGAFGAIFAAVSKLWNYKTMIAKGGLLMDEVGVFLAVLGPTVSTFAKSAAEVYSYGPEKIAEGAATITAIVVGFGALFAAIGTLSELAPVIAIGGALLGEVAGIIAILAICINKFIGVVAETIKYNESDIKKATAIMVTTFTSFYEILEAAAPNPKQAWYLAEVGAMAVPLMAVFSTLNMLVDFVNKVTDNLTPETVTSFRTMLVGKDGSGSGDCLIGSLNEIVKGFSKIDGVAAALIISQAIKPIIDTVSQFIDVIMKVATMNYVSGYDDNGKPIYTHLEAKAFSDAGTAVTKSFSEFLLSLNTGFKDLSIVGTFVMQLIAKEIRPIIDTVSMFIDAIMKVATGAYITGYDENGHPEYEHLKADDFKAAGHAVTDEFKYFLLSLSDGFKSLASVGGMVMLLVGDSIKPVVDTVSRFIDTVIKVATGMYISGYTTDKNGTLIPLMEQLDMDRFISAGADICALFETFLSSLSDGFSDMSIDSMLAIKFMGDSISPVMDGVSKFVDAILRMATGTYIDYYETDKNGNKIPHMAPVTPEMLTTAANVIATLFANFILNLGAAFEQGSSIWGNTTEEALESIKDSVGPVMDGVGKYVEAILMLATGTYLDHMEKDKKGNLQPVYKHLTPGMFKNAAKMVGRMFVEFVTYLMGSLNDDFLSKCEDASDAIKNGIQPIMDAVNNFSKAVMPFLNVKTGDGKNAQYLFMIPGKIEKVSQDIAHAFTTFIGTIADELKNNQEKYESIAGTADAVKKTLATIKSACDSLSNIIKTMTDDKGHVLSQGDEVIVKFTSVLTKLVNYFNGTTANFSAIENHAREVRSMLGVIQGATKNFQAIVTNLLNAYNTKKDINVLIGLFIKNLDTLSNAKSTKLLKINGNQIKFYAESLSILAEKVGYTSTRVLLFTTKMVKARQAFMALDNVLLKNKKARDKALDDLAIKIEAIAKSIDHMKTAIESFDENKVINNFKGIKEMLDTVHTYGGSTSTTTTSSTGTTAKTAGKGVPQSKATPQNKAALQNKAVQNANQNANLNAQIAQAIRLGLNQLKFTFHFKSGIDADGNIIVSKN